MQPSGPDESKPVNPEPPPVGADQPATPLKGALVPRDAFAPHGAYRAPPTALSMVPNLWGLLNALRRRWFMAVSLGLLLGVVAGTVMWYLRPVSYSARTLLRVASVPPAVLFQQPVGDFGNYQRTQMALVKSRLVLNTALRDPKVAALPCVQKQVDPIEWLEKNLLADFTMAPEIFKIAIAGEDPKELTVLVDAVQKAYRTEIVEKENSLRLKRLDQLKKLNAEYDNILRGKRDTLKAMASALGGEDKGLLAKKQEFQLKYLGQLEGEMLRRQSELWTAQLELMVLEAKERRATNTLFAMPVNNPWLAVWQAVLEVEAGNLAIPDKAVEELVNKDRVVAEYLKSIAAFEQEIALFKDRSPRPAAEPQYQRAVAHLATSKKSLEERREKLRPLVLEDLKSKARLDLRANRIQAQDRVRFLNEMGRMLTAEFNRRNTDVDILKKGTVDLIWLQDEILQVDNVGKEAGRQMQTLLVEIQAPSRVDMLEEAFATSVTSASRRLGLTLGTGLGTFAAVVIGIALLEFMARRVSRVEEVIQGLRMRLVGALPTVPKRTFRGNTKRDAYWQNRLTECVDAIRTTLMNHARFERLGTIMVTSAVGGEGKTLLSCHLAASLARAGCKTLLIDGDLRRPSVHRLFGLDLPPGLSELLLEKAEAEDIIHPGAVEGLSVLTAGQCNALAVQALAQRRLGDVLEKLRQDYDFVVIDSAPVLPVADSQLIGQHTDGVVFSVMRDVSRLPLVYAAYERLATLRVRILGAVVNGATGTAYGSSYHYSNSYYTAPPGGSGYADS